jgi:hypothetical protein
MAKSLLQVKTKKKPQKTRSEVYMVNVKYLGEEPKQISSETDMARAFTWYHNMCDASDAKQYLRDYFKADKQTIGMINRIPDSRLPYTSAWLCRIVVNQKRTLTDAEFAKVNGDILNATVIQEETTEKPKAAAPSIQDRMKDKLSDIIGEVEALIDSGESFSLYDWLKANEIPAMYASKIAEYYRPIETEMRLALIPKGQDGYLDGYENWTKPQIRARAEFYGKIVSDAERYGDVTKKTRAPRKPRAVSAEKLLKNLRYQKESNEFKLASINPEMIIGAQELWTFNTKYKVITVFRALDRGGLTVKRSSIANYDEKTSISKGTGRSAEKIVDKLQNGGKIVLRKLMEELKTDKPLQERINENTILVRVIK